MNTLIHSFNADGYYTGSAPAPINPVTGVEALPNPEVATIDPVPAFDAETERVRRVNGVWVVEGNPEVPQDDGVSTECLRAKALATVNTWRIWKEQQEIAFEHVGRRWDGGLTTRLRLKPVLSLPVLPEGFFWTDHGNSDVQLSLDELRALDAAHEVALVTEGFRIHVLQRQMKTAIEIMTREQLEAFDPEKWAL